MNESFGVTKISRLEKLKVRGLSGYLVKKVYLYINLGEFTAVVSEVQCFMHVSAGL